MKLTASELKCLRLLATRGHLSASVIRKELRVMSPQVSRVLGSLRENGFIQAEKVGLSKIVSLSEAKHAVLLRRMVLEFEHVPFHDLLSGATLEVLSAISYLKLRNRNEIRENSLVAETSVAKALERLKQAGIIRKMDSTYSVSQRFEILKDFVTEFRHYLNQKVASSFANDAVVLWECNSELVVESKRREEGNGFLLTGISVFAKFGIQLMAPRSYFFHSPFIRELRLEDVILHSLFVNSRNILPTLLVWKKNEREIDQDYLESRAEKYGVRNAVQAIKAYFTSQGRERPEGYPPWREFTVRAEEYELL